MQAMLLIILRKLSTLFSTRMFSTSSLNLLHSVENIGLLSQSKEKSIKLIELGKFAVMSSRVMIVEAMSISSMTDVEFIINSPIAG